MRVHYKEQQAIEWAKTQEGWAKQREENAQHKAEKAVALTATREANAERATTAKQEARKERREEKAALRMELKDSPLAGTAVGAAMAKARRAVLTAKHSPNKRDHVK